MPSRNKLHLHSWSGNLMFPLTTYQPFFIKVKFFANEMGVSSFSGRSVGSSKNWKLLKIVKQPNRKATWCTLRAVSSLYQLFYLFVINMICWMFYLTMQWHIHVVCSCCYTLYMLNVEWGEGHLLFPWTVK